MTIYTRKGDKGKTALFNGKRVLKSDLRIEVYGLIDELNSVLGVVLSIKYLVLNIRKELIKVQNDLFEISSALANPQFNKQKLTVGLTKRVKKFENFIDKMTVQMPKLSNFILPGGWKIGATLHLARAICRRVERGVVQLNNKQKIDNNIIVYLNRLSDLLFTMARFANFKEKRREIVWSNKK